MEAVTPLTNRLKYRQQKSQDAFCYGKPYTENSNTPKRFQPPSSGRTPRCPHGALLCTRDPAPRRGGSGTDLTEEHEHAHVELQQAGHAESPPLSAAQRVEEQLAAQGALPLLGPHVDLLLAVRKGAVLPVLALLPLLDLCGFGGGVAGGEGEGVRLNDSSDGVTEAVLGG